MEISDSLKQHQFVSLVEVSHLSDKQSLVKACREHTSITGMSVCSYKETLDPSELDNIKKSQDLDLQLHLCGRGRDEEEILEFLDEASHDGYFSILATTGDAVTSHSQTFTDSLKLIRSARAANERFHIAAAVNPFKYNANDSFAQYFKMIQKLNAGADCIITQCGWDMAKLHEVSLYLSMRDRIVPLMARLHFIKAQDLPCLEETEFEPGVEISREFAAFIQREYQEGDEIFYKKQVRRLVLQILGCRFMGFSGVQLKGLENADDLSRITNTLERLEKEITTFSDWIEAWQDFHPDIPMAPKSNAFYLFTKLLSSSVLSSENPYEMADADFRLPNSIDILQHKLCSTIKAERLPDFIQNLLIGGRIKKAVKDPSYLPVGDCPKGLRDGACGGVREGSRCEINDKVCIHSERVSLAAYFNELDHLEQPADAE